MDFDEDEEDEENGAGDDEGEDYDDVRGRRRTSSRSLKIKLAKPAVSPPSSSKAGRNARPIKMKLITFDPVFVPVGDKTLGIDKFISYQVNKDGDEELLVKYKNMSYHHCEWIARKQLEEQDKSFKARIRRFIDKGTYDNNYDDEHFNPSFLKVTQSYST